MSTKITINLKDYSKIKHFINAIMQFSDDIDLKRDRYVVDAKSTIGIFTLDLSKPVEVEIHSNDDKEVKKFNEIMEEFK